MKIKYLYIVLLVFITFSSCKKKETITPKITFIELGSVRCIPCQKMKVVMEKVEQNYPKNVEVIFYDVWTKEAEHFADDYNVDIIPTQVFLDQNGKEYFRHEGFFKYDELEKILLQKIKK